MTLCIAWVRKLPKKQEIAVVADSCFTGGQRFYAAPKIFPLKRNDCVLACAGDTAYSFSVVEHIMRAVDLSPKIKHRVIDITDMKQYLLDITNKCLLEEHDVSTCMEGDRQKGPNFSMILAGFSWKQNTPIIYEIKYKSSKKKMDVHTQPTIKKIKFAVIGDCAKEVRHRIYEKLDEEGVEDGGVVDMQPLDVLMEYIENPKSETQFIGGYPQMVKIYPFSRVLPVVLKLHKENGETLLTYYGRPLLKYEIVPFPIYDVKEKKTTYMKEVSPEYTLESEKLGELPFEK